MHASSSNLSDSVFERTPAGQFELLSTRPKLAPHERKVLAVLTGFTPLSDLLALMGEESSARETVQKMADMGLIRATEGKQLQHFYFGWPCSREH